MLEESFGVKERSTCRVVGRHRSTQRLEVVLPSDDERELRRWLVQFAKVGIPRVFVYSKTPEYAQRGPIRHFERAIGS